MSEQQQVSTKLATTDEPSAFISELFWQRDSC